MNLVLLRGGLVGFFLGIPFPSETDLFIEPSGFSINIAWTYRAEISIGTMGADDLETT